jgi:hypothetical protein
MLQKKLGKLRRASEQFAQDGPHASTHTNFVQAVVSMRAAVVALGNLLPAGLTATERAGGPAVMESSADDETDETDARQ